MGVLLGPDIPLWKVSPDIPLWKVIEHPRDVHWERSGDWHRSHFLLSLLSFPTRKPCKHLFGGMRGEVGKWSSHLVVAMRTEQQVTLKALLDSLYFSLHLSWFLLCVSKSTGASAAASQSGKNVPLWHKRSIVRHMATRSPGENLFCGQTARLISSPGSGDTWYCRSLAFRTAESELAFSRACQKRPLGSAHWTHASYCSLSARN